MNIALMAHNDSLELTGRPAVLPRPELRPNRPRLNSGVLPT